MPRSEYRPARELSTVGQIGDIIVDTAIWKVCYLAIDTSIWWWGKQVLVRPHDVRRIDYDSRTVTIDMWRDDIEASPPYELILRHYL